MAAFHVFVEGATEDSPAGLARLADAIANHYGLGAADILTRLQKGRFRVKANADQATADTYARDLARLGARCVVEEATADNSQRTTPLPFPAARPATPPAGLPVANASGLAAAGPRAGTPSAPPSALAAAGARPGTPSAPPSALAAAGARPGTPSAPPSALAAAGPRASTPPPMGGAGSPSIPPPMGGSGGQQFQSGLSAAFSGELPAADLGALGGEDSGFSLASLDGVDDNSAQGGSIGPAHDAGGMPASIGPAPDKAPDAKPGKAKDEPLDMFAPPDQQGEEFKVSIAADEEAFSARKRASTPPPMETVDAATSQKIPPTPTSGRVPSDRKSQPSMQVPNTPVAMVSSAPSKFGPLGDERVRFAAGVLLAVLLGFIPAHFVAKMKEQSADETIDRKIIAAQQQAETPEVYANLDRMRADQLGRKESEHRNAAIIGFAIWALCGGGIAFAWFKKIPWDA